MTPPSSPSKPHTICRGLSLHTGLPCRRVVPPSPIKKHSTYCYQHRERAKFNMRWAWNRRRSSSLSSILSRAETVGSPSSGSTDSSSEIWEDCREDWSDLGDFGRVSCDGDDLVSGGGLVKGGGGYSGCTGGGARDLGGGRDVDEGVMDGDGDVDEVEGDGGMEWAATSDPDTGQRAQMANEMELRCVERKMEWTAHRNGDTRADQKKAIERGCTPSLMMPTQPKHPDTPILICEGINQQTGERCTRRLKRKHHISPTAKRLCHQHLKDSLSTPAQLSMHLDLESYIDKTLSFTTQHRLRTEIAKPLSASEEAGFIYAYELQAKDFSHLPPTSNHTPPTKFYKIGRATNVYRRLTQWSTQCNYTPHLLDLFPTPSPPPTSPYPFAHTPPPPKRCPYTHRAERLIHIELGERYGAGPVVCWKGCREAHYELFCCGGGGDGGEKGGWEEMRRVIEKWVGFVGVAYGVGGGGEVADGKEGEEEGEEGFVSPDEDVGWWDDGVGDVKTEVGVGVEVVSEHTIPDVDTTNAGSSEGLVGLTLHPSETTTTTAEIGKATGNAYEPGEDDRHHGGRRNSRTEISDNTKCDRRERALSTISSIDMGDVIFDSIVLGRERRSGKKGRQVVWESIIPVDGKRRAGKGRSSGA
ncbi:hypothetical protein HDV00_004280 [Rhizophlyctis rosea]|nr:hypothetical protein HDV00_004280 [Rhizophlyctis rosea]